MPEVRALPWSVLLWLAVLHVVSLGAAEPQGEIAIAIRYLQQSGTSHTHLYLYREDGKLLRQLTTDEVAQESNPVFAPDGETIAFTRDLSDKSKEVWSVEPHGGNLHRLDAAPDWYTHAPDAPYFRGNDDPTEEKEPAAGAPRVIPVPGGPGELVITAEGVKAEDDMPDGFGVQWRASKGGPTTKLGVMPGLTLSRLVGKVNGAPSPVLAEGNLRLMFFDTHLNSTDGSCVHAVDLVGKRLVRLSANGNSVIPLPGEEAFLSWDYPRYVPFGDGKRTANCSYFERWDAKLNKVRYAAKDAAISYGASMYRPGGNPAVITVHGGSDE